MAEGNQSGSPVSKIAVIGMIVAIVLFVSGMPWLWGCEGFPWPSAEALTGV